MDWWIHGRHKRGSSQDWGSYPHPSPLPRRERGYLACPLPRTGEGVSHGLTAVFWVMMGLGEGDVSTSKVIRIDSRTESMSSRTWLFQYRTTPYPLEPSHSVLLWSDSRCSSWCPPSISTTRLCSLHTKSTMYLPIGYWRLNFRPISLRWRSLDHRRRSASVDFFLNFLALDT